MSKKLALILFSTSVLLTSFAAMVVPQASALVNSTYDNSHVTARFESEHKVCGNHVCAPGERTNWEKSVWGSQKMGYGKVPTATHGESVMHQMAGSTPDTTSGHGTPMPAHGMMMTKNGTNYNMTGAAPSGK